jgi:hypothetical protein
VLGGREEGKGKEGRGGTVPEREVREWIAGGAVVSPRFEDTSRDSLQSDGVRHRVLMHAENGGEQSVQGRARTRVRRHAL